MENGSYMRFKPKELVLRDYLATDRTILANERTLLSYIRTAIAFAAAGAALIHFFEFLFLELIGWALIPLAIIILVMGIQRYLRVKQRLLNVADKTS